MAIQFTANFAFPYPEESRVDTADVPRDIKALAVKMDEQLLAARRDDLIGEIKVWPTAVAPTGFLLLDGSLKDRAGIYNKLFLVIGLSFNTGGEASDKFRLPDLRGRVVVGVDGAANRVTGTSDGNLGNAAGEEFHELDGSEMPTNVPRTSGVILSGPKATGGTENVPISPDGSWTGGSGIGHSSMQPYLVLNYIIRYA